MLVETKKYDRRFVISDVHGCSKTLKKLLKKINLKKSDVLFFLGDYIDRGPNSAEVIDIILKLKRKNYNIYTLRGNHEHNLIAIINQYDSSSVFKFVKTRLKSNDLFRTNKKLKLKYKNFIQNTVFYIELEDFFLVHAGFNFKNKNFLTDKNSMLEIRNWETDASQTKGKRIVHGHQPTDFEEIKQYVVNKNMRIPLDNGCVYKKNSYKNSDLNLGRLCCLNLDSFELICQKNID
jgi:serine/threonine protein phosphatase 1